MKIRTLLAAFAAATASTAAFADLDFSAFAHRATIDFDGYAGASTLTNFPALVRLAEGTGGFSHADCALPGGQGVKLAWMEGAPDLVGRPRLVGKPDIGCYESQAQPATVIQLR